MSTHDFDINYEAYFSVTSTINKLTSERGTGGRVSVFIPRARLELGTSYRRTLQGTRFNSEGADLTWEPYQTPVQIRGEWAHSQSGFGYWIQASYRLSQIKGDNSLIGRLEPVFRMQQFFRSELIPRRLAPDDQRSATDIRPELLTFPTKFALNASYGRQFLASTTNTNVWEFGITYRFLFPAWPGASR